MAENRIGSLIDRAKRLPKRKGAKPESVAPKNWPPDITKFNIVRYMKSTLKIRNKEGGDAKPFDSWFVAQRRLMAEVIRAIKQGRPVKVAIHKNRQHGFTTLVQAFFFALLRIFPGVNFLTISVTREKAQFVFRMQNWFYEDLSDTERDIIPRKGSKESGRKFAYDTPHRSEHVVVTGEKGVAGLTITAAHITDAGLMDNLEDVMVTLEPSIPGPEFTVLTFLFVEGTARGKNGFYRICKMAQDPDSGWIFFFAGIKDDPNCRLTLEPGEILDLDEEELAFQKTYDLDDEQMKWVHRTLKYQCHGLWEIFHREHPVESRLSFEFSGTPWFARKLISRDIESAPEPLACGLLSFRSINTTSVSFQEDSSSFLRIYRFPQEGRLYVVGADISFGLGEDYTEIFVLDVEDVEFVAHYRSNRIEPGAAGIEAFKLGVWYNLALIGIENNGPGTTTLSVLQYGSVSFPQTHQGYPNLYYQVRTDRMTKEQTPWLGFATTRRSKFNALERFRETYNAGFMTVNSSDLLYQMDGFGHDETTRKWVQNNIDARTRKPNDDGVMGAAICHDMRYVVAKDRYCDQPTIVDF